MKELSQKVSYFGTEYFLVKKGKRKSKLCLDKEIKTRTIGGFLGIPRERIAMNVITVPTKHIKVK